MMYSSISVYITKSIPRFMWCYKITEQKDKLTDISVGHGSYN